jgi:hypothetical protein
MLLLILRYRIYLSSSVNTKIIVNNKIVIASTNLLNRISLITAFVECYYIRNPLLKKRTDKITQSENIQK